MIIVDEAVLHRVAVSSSIFKTRFRDYRTAACAWPPPHSPGSSHVQKATCTWDSSLPWKVKVPGRIRIHLRIVQVHASPANRLQRGGATKPISGGPERRGHRPLARVGTGTRSEPHPQRVAEVLLQGRFAAPRCRRSPVARLAQSDDRCDRRATLSNRLRIRAVTSDWDTSSSASSSRCVKLLLARGVVVVVVHQFRPDPSLDVWRAPSAGRSACGHTPRGVPA